jgi:hypothetical protein
MWKEHDATELVKRWKGPLDILIDVVGQFPFGRSSNVYSSGQLSGNQESRRTLMFIFREPATIFISKESFSQKILRQLPGRLVLKE